MKAGTYYIQGNIFYQTAPPQIGSTFRDKWFIYINGSEVYNTTLEPYDNNPIEVTLTIILELKKDDFITFIVIPQNNHRIQIFNGTTANIHRLGGPQGATGDTGTGCWAPNYAFGLSLIAPMKRASAVENSMNYPSNWTLPDTLPDEPTAADLNPQISDLAANWCTDPASSGVGRMMRWDESSNGAGVFAAFDPSGTDPSNKWIGYTDDQCAFNGFRQPKYGPPRMRYWLSPGGGETIIAPRIITGLVVNPLAPLSIDISASWPLLEPIRENADNMNAYQGGWAGPYLPSTGPDASSNQVIFSSPRIMPIGHSNLKVIGVAIQHSEIMSTATYVTGSTPHPSGIGHLYPGMIPNYQRLYTVVPSNKGVECPVSAPTGKQIVGGGTYADQGDWWPLCSAWSCDFQVKIYGFEKSDQFGIPINGPSDGSGCRDALMEDPTGGGGGVDDESTGSSNNAWEWTVVSGHGAGQDVSGERQGWPPYTGPDGSFTANNEPQKYPLCREAFRGDLGDGHDKNHGWPATFAAPKNPDPSFGLVGTGPGILDACGNEKFIYNQNDAVVPANGGNSKIFAAPTNCYIGSAAGYVDISGGVPRKELYLGATVTVAQPKSPNWINDASLNPMKYDESGNLVEDPQLIMPISRSISIQVQTYSEDKDQYFWINVPIDASNGFPGFDSATIENC